MTSSQSLKKYLEKYRNKANVVRQIHSSIAESKRKYDLYHTLATLVFGAIFTFTGFMGPERIYDVLVAPTSENSTTPPELKDVSAAGLNGITSERKFFTIDNSSSASSMEADANLPISEKRIVQEAQNLQAQSRSTAISKKVFDLIFNAAALLLFITSILNLVYRWKESHTAHFQGVVKLTAYINWLDEVKILGISDDHVNVIKEIGSRYQVIVESLPPNDEKDYGKAKKALSKKDKIKIHIQTKCDYDDDMEALFRKLIEGSPLLITVLRVLHNTDKNLWLGGGAIRNHVWDQLTGRVTAQDDFDIVYFNATENDSTVDEAIEAKLRQNLPAVLKISVKNQARMHLINGEPSSDSLQAAIFNWPETATALAVRLNDDDELEVIAPHGFTDLFNMTIRPTPYHKLHPASYEKRKVNKAWTVNWPELTVYA